MTKITETQLIESLKQLKEIKPRQEWASLLRSQILAEKKVVIQTTKFADFVNAVLRLRSGQIFSRKFAYSFAVILFLAIGFMGFENLSHKQSIAPVAQENTSQDMTVVREQINVTVKNIAQNLKNNPVQSPQTMKALAKTLANVPGDIEVNSDVKDLYQTVVQSQIADLQKATLTEEQNKTLDEIKDLYFQGKYTEALEKILLINN